jgi:hypothetical protein
MMVFIAARPGASALKTNFGAQIVPISVANVITLMPDRRFFIGGLFRSSVFGRPFSLPAPH